jgi:hypothetical protein
VCNGALQLVPAAACATDATCTVAAGAPTAGVGVVELCLVNASSAPAETAGLLPVVATSAKVLLLVMVELVESLAGGDGSMGAIVGGARSRPDTTGDLGSMLWLLSLLLLLLLGVILAAVGLRGGGGCCWAS